VTRRLLAFVVLAALGARAAPHRKTTQAKSDYAAQAADALFVRSDIEQARAFALKVDRNDTRALFVLMEASALAADSRPELDAALRLCETRRAEPRVHIAAARVLELAANTPAFREALPRIQKLLAAGSPQAAYLRAALVAAAADGVPGLDASALAHDAGIVTHWRVGGPFGNLANVDWEQKWPPESKALAALDGQRKSEDFEFLDGNVTLPGYLRSGDGVMYAETTIETPHAGEVTLRLESAGTAEIFIDDESVLTKDDRLRSGAAIERVTLRVAAGSHRVLVKFLDSAMPWRLAVVPPVAPAAKQRPEAASAAEQRYLQAAEAYWHGDSSAVIAQLPVATSATEDVLLGQAWSRLAGSNESPEAVAHFRAAQQRSPAALAAAYELAAYDFASGRAEDAANAAQRIASLRPDYVPAVELLSEAAERLGWDKLALEAFEHRFQLHPSCDTVLKAARLFAHSARYDRARAMEEEAKDCAPDTLAYSNALSDRGEHVAAAREAQRILQRYPLDRDAAIALARELRLGGDNTGAAATEATLHRVAPNRTVPAEADDDFYTPYRRDGIAAVRAAAERRFSGGPIVTILHDKVARLNRDGSLDEYVHQLTRVLSKEGIEQYGEVAVPADAEVLELRTIKPDGRVFEPELAAHKPTISMPALAPEDVIELEYILHRSSHDALTEYPEAFRFVFGSFSAPILAARFVVELPPQVAVRIADTDLTRTRLTRRDGVAVRTWEADDLAQSLQEPSMTASANLPAVTLQPDLHSWQQVRDAEREVALEAAYAGAEAEPAAASFRGTEEERARQALAYAAKMVSTSDADAFAAGEVTSGEDSLASGEGSRTAAVLALAQATGLDARLVLARPAGNAEKKAAFGVFTRPLVEFVLHERNGERARFADAETPGLAFGALPPDIASGEALEVPLRAPHGADALITLRLPLEHEENVAEAEMQLDAAGDADIHLDLRMGSFRSAQTRATLRTLRADERQSFFEQIALRIFPGATGVTGSIQHESDTDRGLVLALRCRVPRLIDLERLGHEDSIDIDQFVPVLGLKRMYAGSATRKFALWIDAPLFETAVFRLHLPEGVDVAQRARNARFSTSFGDYAVEFRQPDARTLEIRRSFRIPPQVVPAAQYAAFARFASQIEDAERERLSLGRASESAAGGGR
jgi:tetratricopeptide (TPR) repeat protein